MRTILACLCLTLAGCGAQQYSVYSDSEACLNAGPEGSEAHAQCKEARKEAVRQSVARDMARAQQPVVYAPSGYATGVSPDVQAILQQQESEFRRQRIDNAIVNLQRTLERNQTRYYTMPAPSMGVTCTEYHGLNRNWPSQTHCW